MNPFAWRQEHQIAVLLGAILGGVILEVIELMYRGLNYGTIGSGLWSATALGGRSSGHPMVWASAYFGFKIGAGNASCLHV
jgi:hypothetical protein